MYHLVVAAGLALSGCRQNVDDVAQQAEEEASRPTRPAPILTLLGQTLKFEAPPLQPGETETYAHELRGLTLGMSLAESDNVKIYGDLLEGTRITLNGRVVELPYDDTRSKSARWEAAVPAGPLLAEAPLADLLRAAPIYPNITFELQLPHYQPVTVRLPPQPLRLDWRRVEKGPWRMPSESTDAPAAMDAIVFVDGGNTPVLIGIGERVADVDWIALTERPTEPARTVHCSGYTKVGAFELDVMDQKVRIYDRRSGKKLIEKIFLASDTCPRLAVIGEGGQQTWVDEKEIEGWLQKCLGGRSRCPS